MNTTGGKHRHTFYTEISCRFFNGGFAGEPLAQLRGKRGGLAVYKAKNSDTHASFHICKVFPACWCTPGMWSSAVGGCISSQPEEVLMCKMDDSVVCGEQSSGKWGLPNVFS